MAQIVIPVRDIGMTSYFCQGLYVSKSKWPGARPLEWRFEGSSFKKVTASSRKGTNRSESREREGDISDQGK